MRETTRITVFSQIGKNLIARKESISVAESVTSGYLQAILSSIPNAASFFQGGMTAYNLGQKCKLLGLDPIYADGCNCVSEKIALEMAINVSKKFSSQWSVAVVGYASIVPELNIRKLFAYYAVVYQLKSVEIACLRIPRMAMVKAQRSFAEQILMRLSTLTSNHS